METGSDKSVVYSYDGTFEGLLTAVFDAFDRRMFPASIIRHGDLAPMFCDDLHEVTTDDAKSTRVWEGLRKRMAPEALSAVGTSFLCEQPDFDIVLFRYICKIFRYGDRAYTAFNDPDILAVTNMCRNVRRERHRILMFLRFQKASDGTYFAIMEPIYNVLPIAVSHFVDRFNSERFLIYDKARGYGYYYDGHRAEIVTLPANLSHIATGSLPDELMDPDERLFQRLWRTYFDAIAIPERTNPRKQRQDMPVRFWKYLTEKRTR